MRPVPGHGVYAVPPDVVRERSKRRRIPEETEKFAPSHRPMQAALAAPEFNVAEHDS